MFCITKVTFLHKKRLALVRADESSSKGSQRCLTPFLMILTNLSSLFMLWIIYDAHGYDFAEILYVCAKKRSLRYHKHCKVRLPGNNSHILRKYFSSLKNQFPIILDTVFFSWWKLYYVRPRFTGKTCMFRVSRFERYFHTNFEVLKNHWGFKKLTPRSQYHSAE